MSEPLTPEEEADLRRAAASWPNASFDGEYVTGYYNAIRSLLATLDATRDAFDDYRDEHDGWCATRKLADEGLAAGLDVERLARALVRPLMRSGVFKREDIARSEARWMAEEQAVEYAALPPDVVPHG